MYNKVALPKMKRQKFHKDTFDNISEERRSRILDIAITEFAGKGYNAANINDIAKQAEISIGSMYSYFASKEDLFLTIVDRGLHLLEGVLLEINGLEGDLFYKLEKLFVATKKAAQEYPEMNQIYLDLTTQGLSNLASRLSNTMESTTAAFYKSIIREAQEKGIVRKDLNVEMTAFLLDNLLVMYQFSYASDYYKNRMKIFMGEEKELTEKEIIEIIKKALI